MRKPPLFTTEKLHKRGERQVDGRMWREAANNPEKAKKLLVNLVLPDGKVTHVKLENGNKIKVEEVTPEQALEFVRKMVPAWANATWPGKNL